ncbi:unnamed protein product [Trichobilharzia szidati]|nr:unnamed protein product [Trichobilharzia szidati]
MRSDTIVICDCEEKCEHCSSHHTTPQIRAVSPNPAELIRPIYHHVSEFCYDFDSEGILRHIHTGETFSVKMTPMGPLLKRQEIIRAICTRLVRQKLFSLNMESSQIPIPGHPTKCMRVLHSANFFTHRGPIIVLLQGGGVAQAGVWSPRLLLHPEHGLRSGSQIPLVQKAHSLGYAIAIINANEHVPSEAEMDAMESFSSSSTCQPVIDITNCMNNNNNVVNVQCKSAVNEKSSSCISNLPACLTLSDTSIGLLPTTIIESNCDQLSAHFDHANPTFISTYESSSNWQELQPEDRPLLFQPNSTPSSPLSPSSSSALSWLLTGPNSTANDLNVQNASVFSAMPNSNITSESTSITTTTTTATTSDLSSSHAKCVCTNNTPSSPSSSTSASSSSSTVTSVSLKANHIVNNNNNKELQSSQMNTFPGLSAQNPARNAIPVAYNADIDSSYKTTAALNPPICQRRTDGHSSTSTTCMNPVMINNISTAAVPLLQEANGNHLPFPGSTGTCACASSSSSIDATAAAPPIINSDESDTTENNNQHPGSSEFDMLDVSLEDRLYGMWRHIIPHCKSNKIFIWAHQLAADAFIHPFKPMPGLFDESSPSPSSSTSSSPSSSSVSVDSYDETSTMVNNNHTDDNTSRQVQSTSFSASCPHNIPMNSDTSHDLQNVNSIKVRCNTDFHHLSGKLESTVSNSKTLKSTVSLAEDDDSPAGVKRPRLFNELSENGNSNFPSNIPVDDKPIRSNYSTNIVVGGGYMNSSSSSSSSNNNKCNIRFTRKLYLSAGPVLTNLHRNDENSTSKASSSVETGLNINTSSTLARNKSPQSMKSSQTKSVTPAAAGAASDGGDAKENHSEDSTGCLWRDRRIYGPWRHHVTPQAARRALYVPILLPPRPPTTSTNNSSDPWSYKTSVEVKKPIRNKSPLVQLPAPSGSISDAKHFAENGGVISQDVGIWSTSSIDDNDDDDNASELFRIRLARAWQRKARRLWCELRIRTKAVVFTDASCALDISREGIGWGLHLLEEESLLDEIPVICRSSVYQGKLPERVSQFRRWLSETTVNFVAADVELGTQLNPENDNYDGGDDNEPKYAIPKLSSGTTDSDLIPATVLDHVFNFFQSKLEAPPSWW